MKYEGEAKARMRRGLLHRGSTYATLLADLMAGNTAAAARVDALAPGKPGATREERLRAALALIEARRELLDADDERFGRCDACGAELGELALIEMPWADRCRAHSHIA